MFQTHFRQRTLPTLAVSCMLPWLVSPVVAQVHTVALTDTDPGTLPGEFFTQFGAPQLNDAGQLSFTGKLQNAQGNLGFLNDFGIWNYSKGVLRPVVRRDLVPNAEPTLAPCGNEARLTNDNRTLFEAGDAVVVKDPSYSCGGKGLWADDQGTLANVLDRTMPLDGAGGALSELELGHRTNKSGQFVFESTPAGFGRGVWSGDGTSTRLLVAHQGIVPAINNELRVFDFESFSVFGGDYLINELGHPVVRGLASSTMGELPRQREGIWQDVGNGLQLVAMGGGPIDDVANGPVFQIDGVLGQTFSQIQLSDDAVYFAANAEQGIGGVMADNDEGLYVVRDGAVRTIAAEGQPAPGTDTSFGRVIPGTFRESAVNRQGDIAFIAHLSPSRQGVWVERRGAVDLISMESFPGISAVAINDRQQVAFLDTVGLRAESIDGDLITIVQDEAPFEVAPGVFKTVIDIDFAGNAGFNASGQIAFSAWFQDGTWGVFVSDAVVVPEPGSGCCLAWCWIAGAVSRRVRFNKAKI